ncbi:hypothetical protein AURDEDRAFT_127029 [Auricularia subglabra TFB-10046 SS5]|nr:hypothetical protein AURDEDRAFT_127029 [Auricularia subglabra TFB-10046 SS5]
MEGSEPRVLGYFDLLFLFLSSLAGIEEVFIRNHLSNGGKVAANFRDALLRTPVLLPSARLLRVSDAIMTLSAVCPSLQVMVLDIRQTSVTRSHWAFTPGVVRLEVTLVQESWDNAALAEDVSQVVRHTMPSIQYLALLAGGEYSAELGCLLTGLTSALIPRFSGLVHLQTLALAGLADLMLDFEEHFDYGLPGIFDDADAEARQRQRVEAERRVKRAARQAFPSLGRLWIGHDTLFDFTHLGPGNKLDELDALQALKTGFRDTYL